MLHRLSRRNVLAAVVTTLAGCAQAEERIGTFGFVVKVDADGLLNPTLTTVHIQSVQQGLPAALAGIAAGDKVLEVGGTKVAGASPSAMAERMKKRPGDSVVLKLARASGEHYVVTLVAVEKRP